MSQDSRPIPDPTALTTTALHREIGHLKELHAVRFDSIEERLDDTEERRRELKADTEKEVRSALAASKAETDGLRREVADLRERVTASVGERSGGATATTTMLTVGAFLVGVVGVALAILTNID